MTRRGEGVSDLLAFLRDMVQRERGDDFTDGEVRQGWEQAVTEEEADRLINPPGIGVEERAPPPMSIMNDTDAYMAYLKANPWPKSEDHEVTRLWLDTEFNGHGGELISLALAGEDGKHWYGFWGTPAPLDPWVEAHVMPFITVDGHMPMNNMAESGSLRFIPDRKLFREGLRIFLAARAPAIIYADWPDDFAHLMRVMSGPSYEQSWVVECDMRLITGADPRPEVPHNALSDAIALRDWCKANEGVLA